MTDRAIRAIIRRAVFDGPSNLRYDIAQRLPGSPRRSRAWRQQRRDRAANDPAGSEVTVQVRRTLGFTVVAIGLCMT